jgi:hypothetical protein
MKHIVTVEFTVDAEQAPEQSSEEAAVECIQASLSTVVNMVNHSPGTDALLANLTTFVVRRVD